MWSAALTSISRAFLQANSHAQAAAAEKAGTARADSSTATSSTVSSPSVEVSLSPAAQARAALANTVNGDIKQSGLPDSVQKILMSVRESQKQVAQLSTQLQAAMNDKSMSAEMRQAKVSALQNVSAIYQRQISTSTSDLSATMSRLKLGSQDKLTASMLVMSKM